MSLRLNLLCRAMRHGAKPLFRRARRAGPVRFGMVMASLICPAPFGVRRVRGSGGMWFRPGRAASNRVVLWFHGGAYVAGSAFTHRGMLARLARDCGCDVLAPEYPLAPEHPAPAAFEAACRAYADLRAARSADCIVLGGDSAGGGLALALLSHLCRGGEVPAGIILASPWVDLSLSGPTLQDNARCDPLLPVEALAPLVEVIRGPLAATDPRISPLFAVFPAPCPALILVGSTEILRSDAERMAGRLRAAGGAVDLVCSPDAPHVLAYFAPWVPEARAEIRRMAGFISSLPCQPPAGS